MGTNKLIIRLIDVAFIILFGFIGVSGLKTEHVDLPAATAASTTPQKFRELTLQIHREGYVLISAGRKLRLKNIAELERYLLNLRDRRERNDMPILLTVESNKHALMQALIDVIDMCHRNEIQKHLSYAVFE